MEYDKPFGGEPRVTEGEIIDRKSRFVRLSAPTAYQDLPSPRTEVPPLLPDGDDGIRSGDQIRAELAELLIRHGITDQ